jgi:hypothetical protein
MAPFPDATLTVASPTKEAPRSPCATNADAPATEHPALRDGLPVGTLFYNVEADAVEATSSPGSPVRMGSSARVFRMPLDGKTMAVKKILLFDESGRLDEVQYAGALQIVLGELQAARRASALPHIVQYRGIILQEVTLESGRRYLTPVYIVMDWVEGHTLEHLLSTERFSGHESHAEFARVMVGLLLGVAELHFVGLVHNDLSAKNIMVDEHGNVTIVDLCDCSSYVGGDFGRGHATAWTAAAPDVNSTPAKDVFAVAIHVARYLCLIMHLEPLRDSASMNERCEFLHRLAKRAETDLPPEYASLTRVMAKCSEVDGLQRPSARTALRLLDADANASFMDGLHALTLELLRLMRDELVVSGLVPEAKDIKICQDHCQQGDIARLLLTRVICAIQAAPRSTSGTAKFGGICHTLAAIILDAWPQRGHQEHFAFAHEVIGYVEWRMHGTLHRKQSLLAFSEASKYLAAIDVDRFAFRLAMMQFYRAVNAGDLPVLVDARNRVQSSVQQATTPQDLGAFQRDFSLFTCDIFHSSVLRRLSGSPRRPTTEQLSQLTESYSIATRLQNRLESGDIRPTKRMLSIVHIQLGVICTDMAIAGVEAARFWSEAAEHSRQAVDLCKELCSDRGIAVAMSPLVIRFAVEGNFGLALQKAELIRTLLDRTGEGYVPERAAYDNNAIIVRLALETNAREAAVAELRVLADHLLATRPMQYLAVHEKILANVRRLSNTPADMNPSYLEPLDPRDLAAELQFITWISW